MGVRSIISQVRWQRVSSAGIGAGSLAIRDAAARVYEQQAPLAVVMKALLEPHLTPHPHFRGIHFSRCRITGGVIRIFDAN